MPHTSRRKKPTPPPPAHTQKLRKQETDDGWTQVVRGVQNLSVHSRSNPRSRNVEGLFERLTGDQVRQYIAEFCTGGNGRPGDSSVELDAWRPRRREAVRDSEDVEKEVKKFRGIWEDKEKELCGAILRRLLESEIPDTIKSKIAKLVCIGLGSLSSGSRESMRHAVWQFVVLEDIARNFRETNEIAGFEIIVQDPVFNEVDQALFLDQRCRVLDDPAAFDLIDSSTVVFAPHYPVAAWPKQMRLGRAGIVISNDAEQSLQTIPNQHELQQIFQRGSSQKDIADFAAKDELQEFVKTHASFKFPLLVQDEHAMSSMRVYWRGSS